MVGETASASVKRSTLGKAGDESATLLSAKQWVFEDTHFQGPWEEAFATEITSMVWETVFASVTLNARKNMRWTAT